jgi:CHAT domain-containing protein/Flp pilus assembly protein TadD
MSGLSQDASHNMAAQAPKQQSQAEMSDQTVELTLDQSVERELQSGQIHTYRLPLTADKIGHLKLTSDDMDLTATVFGPQGQEILSYGGPFKGPKAEMIVVAGEGAGTYAIKVRSIGKAGHYKLKLEEVRAWEGEEATVFDARRLLSEVGRLESRGTIEALRQAIEKLEKARFNLHAIGEIEGEVAMIGRIGQIQTRLTEFQKAFDSFKEAIAIAHASGNKDGESNALSNLGSVYYQIGDYKSALDLYNQASELAGDTQPPSNRTALLNNLALSYQALGNYQKASEIYIKALSIAQGIGGRTHATALHNIAALYDKQNEYAKAIDTYQQALVIRRAAGDRFGEAATLNNLGTLYNKLHRNDEALDSFNKALLACRAVGYRRGEITTLYGLAYALYDTGKFAESRERLEEAISILESIRTELTGQDTRASFTASTNQVYKLYIRLLMDLQSQNPSGHYETAALEASERARARTLLEQLSEAHVNLRAEIDPALLQQERQIQQQLSSKSLAQRGTLAEKHTDEEAQSLQHEIDGLLNQYQEIETKIRASSPRYAALTKPEPMSIADIQNKVLDPETLLLEYCLTGDKTFLWVVSKSEVKTYTIGKSDEVEASARRFYELLTARAKRVRFETSGERDDRIARADADLRQVSAELGAMLLGPASSQLSNKRLLVVADGILQYVPFSALSLPSSQRAEARARPLVADHEIVTLPSASILSELRRDLQGRKPAPKTVAVFADPVFGKDDDRIKANSAKLEGQATQLGQSATRRASVQSDALRSAGETDDDLETPAIPRLPFTRREAQAIVALVPASERQEALDFDANRAAAISPDLSQYRYVHFATHGYMNSTHPELSGVVLSMVDRQGKDEDGFLRALEVFGLKLPAELVVLSGCRTGLGKQLNGEGMIGLMRGFMYAGAARVMVSLWDVSDQATAELMENFYKAMLGPRHLSPAAALRAAQVTVMNKKEWQSPYFWSAFVLEGEPN